MKPRGWLAPRSGGYIPGEWSGVTKSADQVRPPAGGGGVVVHGAAAKRIAGQGQITVSRKVLLDLLDLAARCQCGMVRGPQQLEDITDRLGARRRTGIDAGAGYLYELPEQ